MTSLVLFKSEQSQNVDDIVKPGYDWGTGQRRTRSHSDSNSGHGSGTFLYTGEPITQNYRNTDITLSKVRINDELVPAPFHTTDISSHQIPFKFPSNHPFTSHISEKAFFPNASFSLDDRPSTVTDPYIVTHKIRGNPYRREVHYHGLPRNQNSKWPDNQYMQLSRSLSDADLSSIYPWPRKLFAPNDNNDFSQNPITNIVKNKEKSLFETTYQSDYSSTEGLGTHVVYDTTARLLPTEQLKPHFKKTLDPARPIEGMQAIHIHGNHQQPNAQYVPTETIKIMSENEKLDDQLRNGTDYVNLPAQMFPAEQAPTWTPRSEMAKTDPPKTEIRFLHHLRPPTTVPQIARDHQSSHQQIETENRLQQLELIRPIDNINLLNIKYRTLQDSRHARPMLPQYHDAYVNTFYDQTGTYIQERSGLYHTDSYDPNALNQSMPELDYSGNHQEDNENLLKDESNLSDLITYGEQTQNKVKPNLFQYKTFGDYQAMRNRLVNKFRVPQDSNNVDPRIQEGTKAFIQRESVYGQTYNTRKFLQENTLSSHARSDPTRLISTKYNTNLERVRSFNSYPIKSSQNQSFNNKEEPANEDIILGPFLPPSPYNELYSTKYITEQSNGYSRRTTNRVYDSPFKNQQDMMAYKFHQKQPTPVPLYSQIANQLPNSAKQILALPGPEIVSRSIESKSQPHSTYQHSYKDISFHQTISPLQDSKINSDPNRLLMKNNDERFSRTSDGRLKQWKLIDLQDRWTKTKTQRQYHLNHPESVPYVGDTTIRAKKEIVIADIIDRQRMMTVR